MAPDDRRGQDKAGSRGAQNVILGFLSGDTLRRKRLGGTASLRQARCLPFEPVKGLGGLGFRGFRVKGLGFRVQGL